VNDDYSKINPNNWRRCGMWRAYNDSSTKGPNRLPKGLTQWVSSPDGGVGCSNR